MLLPLGNERAERLFAAGRFVVTGRPQKCSSTAARSRFNTTIACWRRRGSTYWPDQFAKLTFTCLYLPYHGQSHFSGARLRHTALCFLYRFLTPLRPRLG